MIQPRYLEVLKWFFLAIFMILGCVWFNVKYFPENKYFPEMLFSGKENIFKYLVAL